MSRDEWTVESLRAYLESKINSLEAKQNQRFEDNSKAINAALSSADKAVTAALNASEKAVNKAEIASEKRFDAVNEFRAQLSGKVGREMNPFDTLRSEPMQLTRVENATVAPNAEVTLFNDAGPGVIDSLWMAVAGGNIPVLDGRIRVYNGSSLDVDIDLGTLLVTHWGANGVYGNKHISVDITGVLGFTFTFPIPFGMEGVRVAYYNINAGQTATIYSMITSRHLLVDLGKRLKCAGRRYADQRVTRAAQDVTSLATVTGNPGTLVYHSQVGGDGASNDSWMERNIAITVDGVRTIESSGTEDWFDGAWYFNGRKNYNISAHSFIGTDKPNFNPHVVGMATDLWSKYGGIPFVSSCHVQALTEPGCTTGDNPSWCILYYQDV